MNHPGWLSRCAEFVVTMENSLLQSHPTGAAQHVVPSLRPSTVHQHLKPRGRHFDPHCNAIRFACFFAGLPASCVDFSLSDSSFSKACKRSDLSPWVYAEIRFLAAFSRNIWRILSRSGSETGFIISTNLHIPNAAIEAALHLNLTR